MAFVSSFTLHLGLLPSAFAQEIASLSDFESGVTAGSPTDYVIASAYWYDADGQASLQTAQNQVFKAYEGVLSQGYLPGATWVRLTIAGVGSSDALSQLALRVRPVYLNEVTLFDPALDWRARVTGDAVTAPSNLIRPTNPGFWIPATTESRDIYLRVISTSTHLLDVQVVTPEAFLWLDGFQAFWQGLFFGVVGLILLWSLLEWAAKREALIGRFLLKHVAVTVYSIGYLGYWNYLLPVDIGGLTADLLFSYSIFVLVLLGLRFHVGVLSDYGLHGWPVRLCQVFYIAPVAATVLAMTSRLQDGLILMSLTTLLLPIAVFLVVLLSRTPTQQTQVVDAENGYIDQPIWTKTRVGALSKRTLLIYYGCILLSLGTGATQVLGLYQGNEFVLHVFLFHSVLSSLLMMSMLLIRARDLQSRQLDATRLAAKAQAALMAERIAREDQARMVEMIAHEIKTPLSVLQLCIEEWVKETKDRHHADRSIEEIQRVVEHSLAGFTDMQAADLQQSVDLSALIEQQMAKTGLKERFVFEADTRAMVLGNQIMVEQMVYNFLDNAIKYGALHAPIHIKIRPSVHLSFGKRVSGFECSVINAIGPVGKPEADMVFRRYYRAESAKHLSGTGLGLFLVKCFARVQSGEVNYRPGDAHLEFALWLPAVKS